MSVATTRHLVAERLTAQLLAGPPAANPVAVTERLLAIQAQDLRGAQLAIRARTTGHTVADIDDALTRDRTLLITTLNRGTLHLVRREDYPWLQALTTPPTVNANQTRLRQEGVSPADAERAMTLIEKTLTDDGPLTRNPLRARLAAAGIPTAGQAFAHLVMLSALRGLTIRGPMVGREQAFVLTRDWLGRTPEPVDRDQALAELARRFLAGHGPADDRDLARWAGLPLRDVRAGLNTIADEIHERPDGLVELKQRTAADQDTPTLPPPRLLGTFEPLLMGWTSREPVLGPHQRLVTSNGIFHPFVFVRGKTVGTWRYRNAAVRPELFEHLSARDTQRLKHDAADVERFLSGSRAPCRSGRTQPPARG